MKDLNSFFRQNYPFQVAQRLFLLANPSIRLTLQPLIHFERSFGASRLGGSPDLPTDVAWPEWQGNVLSFLGQINLADIILFDTDEVLPHFGLLSFFFLDTQYDSEIDKSCNMPIWNHCKVIYSDKSHSELIHLEFPKKLDMYNRFEPRLLSFAPDLTMPPPSSNVIKSLNLSDAELEYYWDNIWLNTVSNSSPTHRLLGYPDVVQHTGMPFEGERLLLQIDSDPMLTPLTKGFWGDGGKLYFMVNDDALREGNFNTVRMEYQG